MNSKERGLILAKYLSWAIAAVLVLLPFHALLTTWAGSNFGHLDAWRIWKELAIVAIFPFSLWLCLTSPSLRRWLKTDKLVWLCLAYAVLFVGCGFWALHKHEVNNSALIYSLLSNLRFIGFMMVVIPAARLSDFLHRNWLKLLLGPATIVIIFGLMQRFILSYDFLHHFGYGPNTIPAYQTVDQKLEYRRIQSTMRGANPLGAYLLVVLTAAASQLWRPRTRMIIGGILMAGLLALGFTYSRSAWLALIPGIGLVLWYQNNRPDIRRWLAAALVLGVMAGSIGLLAAKHDRVLQNTFFHTDSSSVSAESSNASRVDALKTAAREVLHEPLGRGPGTAGPASARNNHPARIAENYFLQIGQEVGWLGLAIFLAINAIIAQRLWERRSNTLALVLLASLVGLSLINLVSHAWADDTLGLLFFGLVGIALTQPVILDKKRKQYAKSSKNL